MTPTLTGRSTVLTLLRASVLPWTKERSGWNMPNAPSMNRRFSTSHTEQTCARATPELSAATASSAVLASSLNVRSLMLITLLVVAPWAARCRCTCRARPPDVRGVASSVGLDFSRPQLIPHLEQDPGGLLRQLVCIQQVRVVAVLRHLHHLA